MPIYRSSVSPKGQVTIPIEVRRRLRIKPRDQIVFEVDGDQIRLMPDVWSLEQAFGSAPPRRLPVDDDEVERLAKDEVVQRFLKKAADQ